LSKEKHGSLASAGTAHFQNIAITLLIVFSSSLACVESQFEKIATMI